METENSIIFDQRVESLLSPMTDLKEHIPIQSWKLVIIWRILAFKWLESIVEPERNSNQVRDVLSSSSQLLISGVFESYMGEANGRYLRGRLHCGQVGYRWGIWLVEDMDIFSSEAR